MVKVSNPQGKQQFLEVWEEDESGSDTLALAFFGGADFFYLE
jgi:hypothetical protein